MRNLVRKLMPAIFFTFLTATLLDLHINMLLFPSFACLLFSLASLTRKTRLPLLPTFVIIFFGTLISTYPNIPLLVYQTRISRNPTLLITKDEPSIKQIAKRLNVYSNPEKLFAAVEERVNEIIEYKPDYLNWMAADYWPTAKEALDKGYEDCDGRAILACSILRNLGYEAYVAVGVDHLWVEVKYGDKTYGILNPRGRPILLFNDQRVIKASFKDELHTYMFPEVVFFSPYILVLIAVWISLCQYLMNTYVNLKYWIVELIFNLLFSFVLGKLALVASKAIILVWVIDSALLMANPLVTNLTLHLKERVDQSRAINKYTLM